LRIGETIALHLRLAMSWPFTGSAQTGQEIRRGLREDVRVNLEADSLNAALLGPKTRVGSPEFDFFVREVVREMTSKTGQKCNRNPPATVPEEVADAVAEAIVAALAKWVVASPPIPLNYGPLVQHGAAQVCPGGIGKFDASDGGLVLAREIFP